MDGGKKKNNRKMTRGGWNLTILGVVSTVIAVVLTGVSLLIYHNSGDIYLDRSRPGYLPDEEEIKEEGEKEEEYVFDKSGALTNGWYLLYGEYWVYTDSDGVLVTNKWIKSGGNWYYVDDFCIVTNYSSYKINGKYYDFDSNGICQNPEGRSGPRVIIIQRE